MCAGIEKVSWIGGKFERMASDPKMSIRVDLHNTQVEDTSTIATIMMMSVPVKHMLTVRQEKFPEKIFRMSIPEEKTSGLMKPTQTGDIALVTEQTLGDMSPMWITLSH